MKTTGSRSIPRYELYGCVAIAPGTPAFALPVFRSTAGGGHGQVVDEISGRIRSFRPIELGDTPIVPVAATSLFRPGDNPAYCLMKTAQTAIGGSIGSIRQDLEKLIVDGSASLPVQVQAAALVSPPEERRLRRLAGSNTDPSELPAMNAYNRSLGRIILWDKLVRSAKNMDVAEKTLHLRPQLDLDIEADGSVKLHLNVISAADYPTLDFKTLATAIEIEIGVTAPSNDESDNQQENETIFSIVPDELRAYLDHNFGSDARISHHTYIWTTNLLKNLGFKNIDQVAEAISGYSGRQVSYVATGNLQGQTTKLELLLLAAMGDNFIKRHPWRRNPWFVSGQTENLTAFSKANIPVRNYDPLVTSQNRR